MQEKRLQSGKPDASPPHKYRAPQHIHLDNRRLLQLKHNDVAGSEAVVDCKAFPSARHAELV
eukprot:360793-Chlamydomonas_euryale.AAC.4